ncbi:MAG: DUF58 domain-containing protein [Chloroflexi bacterium AL-W]|nr:DUF58 domain-containing protein [Chloroflexi bacterium AL-N1]NOK65633.1 DUF58 domain-containing protein [Chloroflexi bacterium AL-N10]NOK74426.1 DUF58 domain-containing protein [Chloroflexi bacterium AL-N5]NOK80666.1 DUF58 domain-containing protein [Chloroflexi bacterium AL-W]NOK88684.1 DUF58 domain-containing protein [Chloroflexi bacterium AL-N15]
MIPTLRLLLFLLLGSIIVAGITIQPSLLWLAIGYLVLVAVLVIIDYVVTVKPNELEIERINDSKLSLGANNLITVLITNRSQRKLTFLLRDEYPYQFNADATILKGELAAYDLHEARYHVRPLQRGDYTFGDTNIRYASLLRTFTRQARYPTSTSVKVYPNVLDVRKYDILARKGLLFEIGLRAARIFGTGTEFERLREYNADDEFRRINWKATARRGKPIAAEYETERSQYIMSVIDTGRLMRPPIGDLAKLDYAINTSLLLSYVATLKGDHTGLLTFADDVRTYLSPKSGKGQFYRMLEALYNVHFEPVEADYAKALAYLSLKNKRRSLIIVFTDLVTLDAAKPLIANMARLAQRHLPLCVVVSDPNITNLAHVKPDNSGAVYQRAVAEMLLDERRVVLDTLNRNGVLTLDVPADKLSVSVINKYLELKGRGAI